jgi:hypothetical protein
VFDHFAALQLALPKLGELLYTVLRDTNRRKERQQEDGV